MVNAVDGLLSGIGDNLDGCWNDTWRSIKNLFSNTKDTGFPKYYKSKDPKNVKKREKDNGSIVGDLAFGKSIKKVASKVKSKVKTGVKQYAASTPQGQAITAGQSAMKKRKSKGRKSVIPKPGKKGGTGGMFSNLFSNLTETKIYGIPVLYVGLGTMFIGLPLLKKMGRKR